MDFLKSMKNLVVENVEVDDAPHRTTIDPPKPFPPPPSLTTSQPVDQEAIKLLDEKSKAKFLAAINAKNPKYYNKLNDLLSTLAEGLPVEASRYKMAIKLLSKDGASVPLLIQDLDLCIAAIEENNKNFSESFNKKLNERIGGRQANIATIDQALSQKQQQIQNLQTDLTNLTSQKEQEVNLMNTENQNLNQSKQRFIVVFNQIHEELEKQKENISTYGK